MVRSGFWSVRPCLAFAALGLLLSAASAAPAATVGTITADYNWTSGDNTALHITNTTTAPMTGVTLVGTYGSDVRTRNLPDIAPSGTVGFAFDTFYGGPFSFDFDDFAGFGEASYTFSATLNGFPVTGSFSPSSNASGGFVGFLGNGANGYETDNTVSPTVVAYLSGTLFQFNGFLQPINTDGSSIFKLGSTVPVKFTITPNPGASLTPTIWIAQVSNGVAGTETEAVSSTPASTGNAFRYDATSGQYIYNWGTKGFMVGTYQLRVDLGDGDLTHTVDISLAK